MLLLYIENKCLLTKTLSYLDEIELRYTTDLHASYDSILIAEFSKKAVDLVNQNASKKIFFLTDLEEEKIVQYQSMKNKTARTYYNKLVQVFTKCHCIIAHMPSIQSIIEKKVKTEVVCIPYELPIINISRSNKDIFEKYHLSKRRKRTLILDLEYRHLNQIYELANQFKKDQMIVIGYESEYLLSTTNKTLLHQMPDNVLFIKYIDFNIYSDLCKVCHAVILYDDFLEHEYLDITLLFKKQLLFYEFLFYQDYLKNGINAYSFKNKGELISYYRKMRDEKILNLTDAGYQVVINHTRKEILKKYSIFYD